MTTTLSNEQLPLNPLFIAPHNIASRPVTVNDLPRIDEDGKKMLFSLRRKHGVHNGGVAVAHPQITDRDPLQFFVMFSGDVICNPKIVRHVNTQKMMKEGCLSYPYIPEKHIMRYTKITVEFQTVEEDENHNLILSEVQTQELKGLLAEIWQHEIDHFSGHYII